MSDALATIEYTEEESDLTGHDQPCVYATCNVSGDTAGPVWGDGPASVKRALAMLTERCDCGARWHQDQDGEE